tara:strand:+ start:967 stop:1905 length:939 start_codon:yes stop_codon:yes gene_type:complete
MTIDELYRFVQLIANKEQRGFIKPSEFDILAQQAQLDLIHDRVARYKTEAEAAGRSSRVLVQNHSVLDDIRSVVMKEQLTYDSDENGYGVWKYPINEINELTKKEQGEYLHFLRLYRGTVELPGYYYEQEALNDKGGDKTERGENKELIKGKIDLITHDQLSYRLHSEVLYPDKHNYVAVMFDRGFEIYGYESQSAIQGGAAEIVEITDETVSQYTDGIVLVYIGKPPAPHWGYTIINDQYVYNPSSSNTTQLTLPTKTHMEIAQRMLSYIGISLRDQEPLAYAEAKVKEQSVPAPSAGRPRVSTPTPRRRR